MTGKDIPLNARVFAVADAFDALTSRRPYKEPFSMETSVGIIREARGSHFDPAVSERAATALGSRSTPNTAGWPHAI